MVSSSMHVGLWRDHPRVCSVRSGLAPEFVFPSARQAITAALRLAGFSRAHRVAVPEWSSHCVLSAVGWCATPLPMKEVFSASIPVDGLLIYEQWGWPLVPHAYASIEQHFTGRFIVWDRVDSGHCMQPLPYGFDSSAAQVISFSKLLGYSGGGLLRHQDSYVPVPPREISDFTRALLRLPAECRSSFEYKEAFKNFGEVLHPDAASEVRQNDIFTAIESERRDRISRVQELLDSLLTSDWPQWMRDAVTSGCGPGIAPVLRGASKQVMQACIAALEELGIGAAVYHFNWSGDPLRPAYEPCLAVPVHGQVHSVKTLIATLLSAAVTKL